MGRLKNFIRNINYLTKQSLWDEKEASIVYLTNKILNDSVYEFGLNVESISKLHILDKLESLELLKCNPKSFVRTGDGEVKIMLGMDQPFQRYEKEIADKLVDLLEKPRNDLYIGVNRNYFIPLIPLGNPNYYRRNAYEFRNFYMQHCNTANTYIDATFTAYLLEQEQSLELDIFFETWKKMFENKEITIICGKGILDKLVYNIFELSKTIRYVYGPNRHAWDQHIEIVKEIKDNVNKNEILVFILGMAGKAMIPELTDMGYMCWDVGHLAKYYNAYKSQLSGTPENIAKFFAPD